MISGTYTIYWFNQWFTSNYFNGCNVLCIIGLMVRKNYPASTFGSTDSTTGEWEIKTTSTPSVTMGYIMDFTILKDGNTITDQSSNSNNFTLGGGTLTKTEDCPSNVFATMNPLLYQVASQYASVPRDGNTTTMVHQVVVMLGELY